MAAPLPLRSDFISAELRRQAGWRREANQARRLLALAAIYDGGSRSDAARIGGAKGPAHRLHRYLRDDLSRAGQRRRPRPAPLQCHDDEPASGRNGDHRGTGRSRGAAAGPGRVAPVGPAGGTAEYHADAAAGQRSRPEPGRKRLAVHPRSLALQPHLPFRARHRRPLLPCLERDGVARAHPSRSRSLFYRVIQTYGDSTFGHHALEQTPRTPLAHHVPRPARLGPWVPINAGWCNPVPKPGLTCRPRPRRRGTSPRGRRGRPGGRGPRARPR